MEPVILVDQEPYIEGQQVTLVGNSHLHQEQVSWRDNQEDLLV